MIENYFSPATTRCIYWLLVASLPWDTCYDTQEPHALNSAHAVQLMSRKLLPTCSFSSLGRKLKHLFIAIQSRRREVLWVSWCSHSSRKCISSSTWPWLKWHSFCSTGRGVGWW